jgi:hypothetical protein
MAVATMRSRMMTRVNSDNPNFAHWFRRPVPTHIEVFAIVTDGVHTWREKFKASSLDVAEEQIKEVVQFFNNTIMPDENERERSFVCLYTDDEEAARYKDDIGMSGWLDPEGKFHPCGFGEHSEYAVRIMLEELERDESAPLRGAKEQVGRLTKNQHIPMSVSHLSSGSYIAILGQLTQAQVDWFNRFFYKLCPITQRPAVVRAAKEQGVKLKYDW